MDVYFIGLYTALAINCYDIYSRAQASNSILSKNYKKIGIFFNIFSGSYDAKKSPGSWQYISFAFLKLSLSLFSWINVIWLLVKKINNHKNNLGTPDAIKKLRFTLQLQEYGSEEVFDQENKMRVELGAPLFFIPNDEIPGDSYMWWAGWGSFVKLDVESNTYVSETSGAMSKSRRVGKYEINDEGEVILYLVDSRSSDRCQDGWIETVFVENGYVKEDVIRSYYDPIFKNPEKEIERLKRSASGFEPDLDLKYFILTRTSHVISFSQIRKKLREEYECVLSSANGALDEFRSYGFLFEDSDEGVTVLRPEDWEGRDEEIKRICDDIYERYNIGWYDLQEYKKRLAILEKWGRTIGMVSFK